MGKARSLGELQLAIMQVLWERGEAAASEVHQALRARGLALTTIATMLRKLEEKGVVRHRADGRTFVYRPVVAAGDVSRSMVGALVEQLFGGDPKALVSHLLDEGEIELSELDELRRRVRARERKEGRDA